MAVGARGGVGGGGVVKDMEGGRGTASSKWGGGEGALGDRAWKGSWMVSSYTPFPPVPVLPQLVALVTALSALRQCGAAETQPREQETRQIHRGGDTGNKRMKTAARSGAGGGEGGRRRALLLSSQMELSQEGKFSKETRHN